jgi:hypothetical protein
VPDPPLVYDRIAIGVIECCDRCQPDFGKVTLQDHRIVHAVFHSEHCSLCEIWWTTTPEWPANGSCPRCGRDSEQRRIELEHQVAIERWEECT